MNLDGEEYLTAAEACASLGIKAATLYAYVSRGLLQSYRQGIRRRRLYKRREVEKLLQLRPSADVTRAVPAAPQESGEPAGTGRWESGGRIPRREVPRAEDWIPFVN